MAKVELQFGKNPVLRRLAQGIIVEQLQEIGVMQRELRQPPAASVSFIDTASNSVKYVTYVGRSPHEAFFTPDGKEVWVSVRGENYIAILDGQTHREKSRIEVPNGPGMKIFSPDGKYGYVCSSFSPETVAIDTARKQIVGRVKQEIPFCPDIAATPDGKQVWFTSKTSAR